MAFEFFSPLKAALAPIASSASGLASWLVNRFTDKSRGMEQRVTELETGLQEQAKTLVQLAEQVQIMAAQMEEKDRQVAFLRRVSAVSWIALGVALAALAAALIPG